MRIFNLTDVSTKTLKNHGLVNQTFSIGGQDVAPGSSVVVDSSNGPLVAKQIAHLLRFGAVSLDKAPANYKPAAVVATVKTGAGVTQATVRAAIAEATKKPEAAAPVPAAAPVVAAPVAAAPEPTPVKSASEAPPAAPKGG
jgi:hypothetical protein